MKRLLYLFVGFFVISCTSKKELPELTDQVATFNVAFEQGDVEILASMITENYVHTNSSWKSFGKEQWLGYMRDRSEKLAQGTLKISNYEMSEVDIQYHGTAAVVTGKIEVAGNEDGIPFSKEFRVTNLWVLQGAQWQRAAFHDTPIQ